MITNRSCKKRVKLVKKLVRAGGVRTKSDLQEGNECIAFS